MISNSTEAIKASIPRVAIIGGGITGACAASTLIGSDLFISNPNNDPPIMVDIFDQGRSGPGGRASQRKTKFFNVTDNETTLLKWDHGCQFFRADTPRMQALIQKWTSLGLCHEWKGSFRSAPSTSSSPPDFFGMPLKPPFYTWGSPNSLPYTLLQHKDPNHCRAENLVLYSGTRVAGVEKRGPKWFVSGTSGKSAFHDTPKSKMDPQTKTSPSTNKQIGASDGYDAIICTDVSSSFSSWHRASANLPPSFSKRVRDHVGPRVPLFTSLIAFEGTTGTNASAIVFSNNNDPSSDIVWFAARSNSKQGMEDMKHECWTIVSTPKYALQCIEGEPMQDPITKEFKPQTKEYLLQQNENGPGYMLEQSFLKYLSELEETGPLPPIIHRDAQRWGSAMPARKTPSPYIKTIMDVTYDLPPHDLAPTKEEHDATDLSFIADDQFKIYQAGDMVSKYTPGFEGAVLSGIEVAEHVRTILIPEKDK